MLFRSDIPDLGFALDYQRILKVYFVLRRKSELLLLLLLAGGTGWAAFVGGDGVFEGSAGGGCGRAFFGEGGVLDVLEFTEGSLELAG